MSEAASGITESLGGNRARARAGAGLAVGGDGANGADKAGGGTWGTETQAEGKGSRDGASRAGKRMVGSAGSICRAEGDGGRADVDVAGTSGDDQIAMSTMSSGGIDWAKGTRRGSGGTGGVGSSEAQACIDGWEADHGGVARAEGMDCRAGVEVAGVVFSGQGQRTGGLTAANGGTGSGGTGGIGSSGEQMGSGLTVSGKAWARGTGCGLGCGSGGIGGVDTGDGDGADGAGKAGSGTQGIGMQTKGKGSGRATELAGIIGRAQGSMESGSTGLARTWHGSGASCKGRGCMTGAAGDIG